MSVHHFKFEGSGSTKIEFNYYHYSINLVVTEFEVFCQMCLDYYVFRGWNKTDPVVAVERSNLVTIR